MSKKKLTGITVGCIIAITIVVVLIHFKPWERTYALSISVNPSQAGSVSPSGGYYESGVQVTLMATPASGYRFINWTGDVGTVAAVNSASTTITMHDNYSITANFETEEDETEYNVCEVSGVRLYTSTIDDEEGDVSTDSVDILRVSLMQISADYLQLDMKLATNSVPFYPNQQNYLWCLDTDYTRPGDEFLIRLNAVSGSGVRDTWHVWIESMIEGGRGIYHFPAAKFDDTFSVIIPLELLYRPDRITWFARAEYVTGADTTVSSEYDLDYGMVYPDISIETDAEGILSDGAYFNDLGTGGTVSFSISGPDENKVEYFSSYTRRLALACGNQFQGNGNGISMLFARVNGCYLIPDPLVIANGNQLLQGENIAFVFNTPKNYDTDDIQTLDILAGIESDLIGYYPHNGQLLIVEESDSNVLASPNTEFPIPVPLWVPNTPAGFWGYFTHEYGHHFHGGNPRINQLFKDFYCESIPSLIAHFALEEAFMDPTTYGVPSSKLDSIQNELSIIRGVFLTDLAKYEERDSPFEELNVWPPGDFDPNNVFNGMMLRIQDTYGREAIRRFFELFHPPTELMDMSLLTTIQPTNQDQKHTAFVAAWSAAVKSDLRPLFSEWNYPIDNTYFDKVYSELSEILE